MRRDIKAEVVLAALGFPLVVWLALLIAPALSLERSQLLAGLAVVLENPFAIEIVGDSFRAVLVFSGAYALGIAVYFSSRRNWRRREEHGSAKWGDTALIARKYRDRRFAENKIFTRHFRLGFNVRRHRRNLNTLVVGGSGAGKTRGYAMPNVMQANASMVILDPNGKEVLGYILQAVH